MARYRKCAPPPRLTLERSRELAVILAAVKAAGPGSMTERERAFVDETGDRFGRFGRTITLSGPQWAWLRAIAAKVRGGGP